MSNLIMCSARIPCQSNCHIAFWFSFVTLITRALILAAISLHTKPDGQLHVKSKTFVRHSSPRT